MADRYLRATGNWNGPVWASASSGTAGSAATPTASDDVYISNNSSFTVTLTADATCNSINQYATTKNGDKINLSNYKLTVNGNIECYSMQGSTIEGPNGTIEINGNAADWAFIAASGSTVIVNASASKALWLGSFSYKDFFINLGVGVSTSVVIGISGVPTLRSLIIQSKNSAAHRITFDSSPSATVNKFVAIGSSASNKLIIENSYNMGSGASLNFTSGGSSYGQYVNMTNVYAGGSSGVPKYIGANSIDTNFNQPGTWLLQDPPKISTLVDPLTTAPGSNPNWTVSGTFTQVNTGYGGGGYSGSGSLTSTGTFDLSDSTFVFESVSNGDSLILGFENHSFGGATMYGKYNKVYYSNGNLRLDSSSDGITFSNISSIPVSDISLLKSTRVSFSLYNAAIGSINILPGFPLVDSENYAGYGFEDKTNPAASSPFPSGDTIRYKPYSDLETSIKLPKGTYYWRVRAKDPTGSDTWGDWSEVRSFEVKPDNGNFFAFFYP